MNILIVNPPIRLSDKPRHIPHGLAIIANLLRKKTKANIYFLDINAHRYPDETIREIIKDSAFDVMLLGGLIPTYKRFIRLSEIARQINSDGIIIAGGSAAMSVPELLLSNSDVDVICAGEGELATVELINGLAQYELGELTEIKGFYFKIDNEIKFSGTRELIKNLDYESDLPAYDMLPMDIYLQNPVVGFGKDIDFISSRGCPFHCTFCYQPWGNKFRGHSVDYIIDGLLLLKKKYDVDFISFQDDEFMANKNRVYEFCEKIQSQIPGLLWSCTGRANIVSEDIVSTMRKAGCVSISYGFESGSPRMLKRMRKQASIVQMENALRINRKYGMMVPVSFIVGMPGEDNESCKETVEFCVNNKLPLKSIMFATPYPGTELFEFAVSTGLIDGKELHEYVIRLGDARDFTINLTDAFTDAELIEKREEMIREVNSKIASLPVEIYFEKLRALYGNLIDDYLKDESLIKHRAEHGGIDLF